MRISFNPCGFWLSEKLDGCRAIWTGSALLSRHGRDFRPPPWFVAGLPNRRLDGELYCGRGTFPELVSIIQRKGSQWEGIRFEIFDLAELRQPIETRLAMLAGLPLPPHCGRVAHRLCTGRADLDRAEVAVVAAGGEGLCLRAPRGLYRPNNFFKVKRLHPDFDRSQLDNPKP